jgi:murein DD-endopeptidase MepM/ murein hydrolase activator NlpD
MKKPYNPGSPFRLKSGYVWRINPVTGKDELHPGYDFAAPAGTLIPAAEPGTVVFSGFNSGFGNVVIVRNDSGEYSLYGHMLPDNHAALGQRIWPGDTIGRVGSTGMSTGNHLHYSVIKKEAHDEIEKPDAPHNGGSIGVKVNEQNTIDPATYVPEDP